MKRKVLSKKKSLLKNFGKKCFRRTKVNKTLFLMLKKIKKGLKRQIRRRLRNTNSFTFILQFFWRRTTGSITIGTSRIRTCRIRSGK